MATWFTGSYEGCEDQVGVRSYYDKDNNSWSTPEVICPPIEFNGERYITEQVLPLELASGDILYFTWGIALSLFKLQKHAGKTTWRRPLTEIKSFTFRFKDGKRYDVKPLDNIEGNDPEDQMLFQGQAVLRAPQQGPAGGWIIPYEFRPDPYDNPNFHSRFLFVDGKGNIKRNPDVSIGNPFDETGGGCLEPALTRINDKHWICLMRYGRQHENGRVWRSDSHDGGWTFSEAFQTSLRNNHCAVDLEYNEKNGSLLVAFNDSHGLRTPLTIGLSEDLGDTFITRDLAFSNTTLDGSGASLCEYSYPKIHTTTDGQTHVLFTYNRSCIAHSKIDLEWLRAGRKANSLKKY
ncbi:MAG: exo-alpha-sialidase [Kiritimatiellia bacterium]|nr:exo-alpha-sialidase [Lentisphaerota bacterium]